MKKIIAALVIGMLVFAGCTTQPTETDQTTDAETETTTDQSDVSATNIFENELFSLTVPTPYKTSDATSGILRPAEADAFHSIVFTDENITGSPTVDNLKSVEEKRMQDLCENTDSCGEIGDFTEIEIGPYSGVKYTVKYQGRSIDDPEGLLYEFYYTLLSGNKVLRFWTTVSDIEDPERAETMMDEVMNTIRSK